MIYDNRFQHASQSEWRTKSQVYLISTNSTSDVIMGIVVIVLMLVMIVSAFLEFLRCKNKKDFSKKEYLEMRQEELTEYCKPAEKQQNFKDCGNKILIYQWPNPFAVITILNFSLSIGLIIYYLLIQKVDINWTQTVYFDLINQFSQYNMLRNINCVNIFFLSLTFFYIVSKTFKDLGRMTAFFLLIKEKIFSLAMVLMAYLLLFATALFTFYDMRDPHITFFSNSLLSVYSQSLGNQYLNENEDIINDVSATFYWLLMAVEYILIYLMVLNIIYVIMGREFIRKPQDINK